MSINSVSAMLLIGFGDFIRQLNCTCQVLQVKRRYGPGQGHDLEAIPASNA